MASDRRDSLPLVSDSVRSTALHDQSCVSLSNKQQLQTATTNSNININYYYNYMPTQLRTKPVAQREEKENKESNEMEKVTKNYFGQRYVLKRTILQ